MTDTNSRDLIRRLTKNLDHLNRLYNVPDQSALVEESLDFLSQPEPDGLSHETAARNAVESCLAQREEVLEAFIAKHGFCPDEAIQVEQQLEDGSTTWRIERRAALAQPDPEEPTDEEIADEARKYLVNEYALPADITFLLDPDNFQYKPTIGCFRAVIAADRARWSRPTTTTQETHND